MRRKRNRKAHYIRTTRAYCGKPVMGSMFASITLVDCKGCLKALKARV